MNPTNNNPSPFVLRILRMFCPDHLFEEIEGDLLQKFQRDVRKVGIRKAKRRFVWNALRFFRPGIVLRNKISIGLKGTTMFSHFFKIFFRTTLKNPAYSFINISGLAVGLACSVFILLWILNETTYDQFHTSGDRIYQVMGRHTYPNAIFVEESTTGRLAEGMKELPEVEESCRLSYLGGRVLFNVLDKSIYERGVYADPSLFSIFTMSLLEGDVANPLPDNNSVALSQKLAHKYFKNESAIGKTFRVRGLRFGKCFAPPCAENNGLDVKVTSVFADLPQNSTLQFDFVLHYQVYAKNDPYNTEWGAWTGGNTFVKLHPAASQEKLNGKVDQIITRKRIWPRWDTNVELFLFPLTDLRLYNNFDEATGKQQGGRVSFVKAFAVTAFFILLIACVNFMNLATARSIGRSREVGVRKVVGAARRSLVGQFMTESILISLIAMFTALLAVHLLLPTFNDLTEKRLTIDYRNPLITGGLIGVTLITGLLAGSYPAFFLSSLKAVNVLKGKFSGQSGAGVRKTLVVVQFSLSAMFIVAALVVYNQIEFMRNKNLGFDKDHIFHFKANGNILKNFEGFRNEALLSANVKTIGKAGANPMDIGNGMVLNDEGWPGKTKQDNFVFSWMACDYDFLPALGFTVLQGRNFSRESVADSSNFIISEETARLMKLQDPVGQEISAPHKGKIIGVVQDFHSTSLARGIQPVIIAMKPISNESVYVRYEAGRIDEVIKHIEKLHRKFEPDFPLEITFMDETFGRQYQNEIMIGKLSTCFTLIAIFISCLGLFGLSSFTAERRVKEIGIRKVLGATVSQLVALLCRDFILLVVIALAIGLPLAWWGATKFLEQYQFHVDLSMTVFVVTSLSMLLIALLTVSWQSARAAMVNPVKSLKMEQ